MFLYILPVFSRNEEADFHNADWSELEINDTERNRCRKDQNSNTANSKSCFHQEKNNRKSYFFS